MKKFLYYTAFFIIVLLLNLYVHFPYQTVADYYLKQTIKTYNLPINYKTIKGNAFKTEITNISIDNLEIKEVIIHHNILNLIKRKIPYFVNDEKIKINGEISKNIINFQINSELEKLSRLFETDTPISGKLTVKGTYNFKNNKLTSTVYISNLNISIQKFNYSFDKITAEIKNNKNRLEIVKINSTGKNKIDLKGYVLINPKKLEFSRLNLKGSLSQNRLKINFRATGTISNPRIRF
ncbi:hypothetical protein DEFDS_1318 [Deferribacter desulfuricans SSM1]|uniref:Uncharacterized protein n=1 Tax=Deferribacter desulfuricans (strain DSM 14783 / JCM 11476 / NBRC 101012 / SSM1) TaxID=639282 RepID=D3PDW2_DEFDS|nr:hypothetical protein [Deferribacter desulfuricans]BAI80785.1 hypothetical protein DEFDS_1318 [Deferribacter desulfuricans SSM1]